MKLRYKLIVLSVFCSIFSGALYSQTVDTDFPYNLPLTTGDGLTTIKYSGKNTSNATVNLPSFDGSGMKVASEGVLGSFSGAYFNDLSFSTTKGFVIDFVYEFYSQTLSPLGIMGDGFALVLFDGSVSNPTIGSNGSGLGYAYNRILPKSAPGLTGGFLGIGFDVFGAYKNQGFSQVSTSGTSTSNDSRTGIYVQGMPAGFQGSSDLRNFVTIRGPVNPITTYGTNMAGYPTIFSQNTSNPSLTSGTLYNATLNPAWTGTGATKHPTNSYVYKPVTMKSFTIAGGASGVTYPSANYRKVRIEMIPDPSTSGVFYINVLVTTDDAQNPIKVVDKFKYDENSTIIYPEIIDVSLQPQTAVTPTSMSLKAPKSLKLGWTASTGNAWANIILKDASVTLPYSPVVTNDFAKLCNTVGSNVTVNPLDNDYGYGASPNPTTDPVPSKDNISKSSFRFMVPKGSGKVGYTANSTPYEYKSAYATYTYNASTGVVTATVNTAVPDGTVDNVYYDVTDNTRTSKEYRSKVATIAFTYDKSLCPVVTINNPVATPDIATLCNTSGSTATILPLSNDKGYNSSNVESSENLNKSSFIFTNSAGTAVNATITSTTATYSTSKATYVYTYSNANLKITALSGISSGNTDVIYYTIKNTGGSVASNAASITSTFSSSLCGTPVVARPPELQNVSTADICNTSGTTFTASPLTGGVGYAIVNGSEEPNAEYIDKNSFVFTSTNSKTYSSSNATYTYNATTGVISAVVKAGASTGKEYVTYTVKNTGGTTASNPATLTVTFKSCTTPTTPPNLEDQVVEGICKTKGTTFTINPYLNATNTSNIDNTSFIFSSTNTTSYEGTYATYTFNTSTGLIAGVVKVDGITGEVYDQFSYSVATTGGSSAVRSNEATATVIFNDENCTSTPTTKSGWIKINGNLNRSTNNVFINGMGGLPPKN